MAGSLDDRATEVLGKEDYDYVVISRGKAEIRISPCSLMSKSDIVGELRRVADFLEAQNL